MNKIKIDFPEKFQKNAFCLWFENEGFEEFQKYYAKKMPEERQPNYMEIEYDADTFSHYITVE